jgi:adenosylhomocysteine nucleosidase
MSRVFIVAVPDEVETQTTILGSPVIFSGVGKINATMAAYRAFSEGYKEVINIGSCGSLRFKAGDIVKVGQVFQDIDATPLQEYGSTPFEASSRQIVLDSDSNITCFTTDYFFNMKFTSYKWVSDDGDANSWKEMCHIGFEKVKDILK